MKGRITHVQRLSVHDGSGIRSTVFLQGCNLRCRWCHNPETWDQRDVVEESEFGREIIGKTVESIDIVNEILDDKLFFMNSGGGVTISGGEPLVQPDFTRDILHRCRKHGIHTGIETNLCSSWEIIKSLLPYVNLWMCDLKSLNDERHVAGTGVGNRLILENFKKLALTDADIIVRTPVIPGFNDSEKDIRDICDFLSTLGHQIRYELLGFHTFGFDKYKNMSIHNPMEGSAPLDKDVFSRLKTIVDQWNTMTR